jgi:hypothetical protein
MVVLVLAAAVLTVNLNKGTRWAVCPTGLTAHFAVCHIDLSLLVDALVAVLL